MQHYWNVNLCRKTDQKKLTVQFGRFRSQNRWLILRLQPQLLEEAEAVLSMLSRCQMFPAISAITMLQQLTPRFISFFNIETRENQENSNTSLLQLWLVLLYMYLNQIGEALFVSCGTTITSRIFPVKV